MRYNLEIDQIIKMYAKKINRNSNSYFLLLSSITQIVFLNFKDYAVIHSSVEIAKIKKLKIYPAFVNAFLRNIARNKKKLSESRSTFSELPRWFRDQTRNWDKKIKIDFVETIKKEPDIHIIFKESKDLKDFHLPNIKTTKKSMIVKNSGKIENLPKYNDGIWWVQDFSSMLPLFLFKN